MKKYFISLPLLVVGAVLVLSQNAQAAGPAYFKGSISSKITSVTCGETYSFDVEGRSGLTIWLEQLKGTGETTYNGPVDLPMSPYTSVCNQDEGIYNTRVWDYAEGKKGKYLGSTIFTINPATNRHFSFTPDGGTLVAGKDAWTFTLSGGIVGDKLTATANLITNNGTTAYIKGPFEICTITSGTSCRVSRIPTNEDVGTWHETIYINGVYKGKITVTVVASSVKKGSTPAEPPPASGKPAVGPSYTFKPNHGKLFAGKDSWSMSLNNANDGDELYIEAWRDGKYVDRMTVCTVSNYLVLFPSHSCSNSFLTHAEDVGHWEFKVGDLPYSMRAYSSTEGIILGKRGEVSFEVVDDSTTYEGGKYKNPSKTKAPPPPSQGTQNYDNDIVKIASGVGRKATFSYWLVKEEDDQKFSHKIPKLSFIPQSQQKYVKKVDPSFLSEYQESNLIKKMGDASIYQLEDNVKHLIPDEDTFDAYGFDWDEIFEIPDQEFKRYKTGDPLPSVNDEEDEESEEEEDDEESSDESGGNIFRSVLQLLKLKR